jgi:hypothetical protein
MPEFACKVVVVAIPPLLVVLSLRGRYSEPSRQDRSVSNFVAPKR